MAAAEILFLGILAAKVEKSLQKASEFDLNDTVSPQANLVFYRRNLEKRIHEVSRILASCSNHPTLDWPSCFDPAPEADMAARNLKRDLKYILELAEHLRSQFDREMVVMMNATSIAEMKRGVQQGSTLFKFTLVASVFVLLLFTNILFGMNVAEFGQVARPHLWMWLVFTLGTVCVSFLFLFWNQPAPNRAWALIKRLFLW